MGISNKQYLNMLKEQISKTMGRSSGFTGKDGGSEAINHYEQEYYGTTKGKNLGSTANDIIGKNMENRATNKPESFKMTTNKSVDVVGKLMESYYYENDDLFSGSEDEEEDRVVQDVEDSNIVVKNLLV